MMKTLISSLLLVVMLCGAALADAPGPARPLAQPLDVTVVVNTGSQPRRYLMKMLDDSCSSVSNKFAGKLEDQIRLCASDGPQVKLTIDWFTRDGMREFHSKANVVAQHGATFDLDVDGTKFTVTVK